MKESIEARKINLIKFILSIKSNETLNEIETFLNQKIIKISDFISETETEQISKKDFQNHIEKIRKDVEKGKYIEHSEILKEP